jgi:hypothetical protein
MHDEILAYLARQVEHEAGADESLSGDPDYGHDLDDHRQEPWLNDKRDASREPQRGQETAQEAAGDDPGGSVGNDARDTLRGREGGAESVEGD